MTTRTGERRPSRRRAPHLRPRLAPVAIVAAAAIALTGGALTGCAAAVPREVSAVVTPAPTPTAAASAPPSAPPAAAAAPVAVSLPSIGLDETLIDLGLQADGSMEVPTDFSRVGWFTGGGRPGGIGPTVIAGHVDSATGPAVFARLEELVVGDLVTVTGADGRQHRYRVTETADYPKSEFPTARVFGASLSDSLRLITCGGVFDRASGHYTDNRVVYAEPVKSGVMPGV